jgi:hypothetical protein
MQHDEKTKSQQRNTAILASMFSLTIQGLLGVGLILLPITKIVSGLSVNRPSVNGSDRSAYCASTQHERRASRI